MFHYVLMIACSGGFGIFGIREAIGVQGQRYHYINIFINWLLGLTLTPGFN